MINNKIEKIIGYFLLITSTLITIGTFLMIIFFIFNQGMSALNLNFITTTQDIKNAQISVSNLNNGDLQYEVNSTNVEVSSFNSQNMKIESEDDVLISSQDSVEILNINGTPVSYMDEEEINTILTSPQEAKLKISYQTEGILSMIIATLITIIISISISLPLGIISAIFLVEYQKDTKFNRIVHFAIDSLAAIPSIVFGLFGVAFFIYFLKLPMSLLTGSLTVSIMLLPVLIRSTEEALLSVPGAYREGSFGLGATKIQTIFKVVLPSAIGGIVVGVILAIGRVIGESAILVFCAGTVDKLTLNPLVSSSTMTVKIYMLAKEYGDITTACAIGIIILILVLLLNLLAKAISKKFEIR